jgi:hypothetical protein
MLAEPHEKTIELLFICVNHWRSNMISLRIIFYGNIAQNVLAGKDR